MARKYDIIERLKAKNEKPFIMIDGDNTFAINTEKTNVLGIMALVEDIDADKPKEQLEIMDKIMKTALGSKAQKYIKSLSLTTAAEMLIIQAIIAAISDADLDDIETEKK
ncbi:MAG: hypothetical protein ACK5LC_09750 [Coprobacillaceae bacterium]